jgi:Ca-activated chloride channel family protein
MDETSLQFAQPYWIIVGLVVCTAIVGLFIRFDRRRESDLAKLVHPRFRQRLTEGFSPWLRNFKRGLWLLAVLLLFVAIARPQKGYEWREVKRKGIDILFAVDTSRSMLAEDLTPNRLERARLGIIDFVARLEGDRVGLIPFAGSAFALCPLTLDYEAFQESLNALDTDLIPRQGTDLASAIKEAERLFDENGNNHRVLVLLTDGEDLQGDVIDAAKAAAKNGMAIYTVGVGSPEGANIPIPLGNGRKDFVRDESGKVVKTTLDETTLKKIAEVTNALYAPLGRGAEGLDTIYQEKLRLVPKSELNQRMERIPLERFEWPLGAAIILLLFEFFIVDRRRAKTVRPLPSAGRRTKIVPTATAVLVMGLVVMNSESQAVETVSVNQDPRKIYNEGTEAYTKGDFVKASESLRSSLRTQDLALQQRSYYNLGNTLYRTGQGTLEKDPEATIKTWEESLKAYQDALALNAADEDAAFNKALVEKKLEELKKQQKQDDKKDDKEKKDDQEKKDEQDKKDEKEQKDSKDGKDPKDGEQPKDGKDSKDGEKPEDGKDPKEGEKPGEGKDSKDGEKPEDGKDPKEGEKPGDEKDSKDSEKSEDGKEDKDPKEDKDAKDGEKSGDGKSAQEAKEGDEKSGEKQQGEMSNERAQKQEMTPEEAKQLLEALRQDERTVIPIPQQRRTRFATPDNSTKGKTW